MIKSPSHQLHTRRWHHAKKSAKALAKWLNEHAAGHKSNWPMQSGAGRSLVQEMLDDARVVFMHLAKYKTEAQLRVAHKKLPPQFLESYGRLNDVLETFPHFPRIELGAVYEGNPVTSVIMDDSPLAHVTAEVGWLLR